MSGTRIESKIAIHYSTDAMSNFAATPLIKGFEYRTALIENFHRAFRHFNTDITTLRTRLRATMLSSPPS